MHIMFARIDSLEAITGDRFAGRLTGRDRAGELSGGELVQRACAARARFGLR
jgi:hypothetical protein